MLRERWLRFPLGSLFVLVLAVALAVACGNGSSTFGSAVGVPGSDGGGNGPNGSFGPGGLEDGGSATGARVAALAFDPEAQTLTVDGAASAPKSASFTLRATQLDGTVVSVTPESLQFDRPDLASEANGTPVTLTTVGAFGGTGRLHAVYGGLEAQAQLTVNVARKDIGDGVTTDIVAALDDNTRHEGEIELQSTDGVSSSIRLTNLDDPPALADRGLSVEPTFNPVQRGNYSWVVFTSMRDWGNKLTGTPMNGKRRLWVAAIDQNPGTTDPSHPAFYLEGQEDTPNMRGFWTLAACTATPPADSTPNPDGGASAGACQAGFECCSGFCDRGVCVDVSKIACAGVGADCASPADCCNAQSVSCASGKCAPNVVK